MYDWVDESDIAKTFKTNNDGTSPGNFIAGAKKYGYKVEVIPRNIKGVKEALNKGYGVIAHIDTCKASCLGYRSDRNYGHYINIQRVTKPGNYRIFDPTKGVISCKPEIIDKAMYNRIIHYYSIKPM